VTGQLLALANRLLPTANGGGTVARLGKECETPFLHSVLDALTSWAAERNNELVPTGR
jgi:hypothetical protein